MHPSRHAPTPPPHRCCCGTTQTQTACQLPWKPSTVPTCLGWPSCPSATTAGPCCDCRATSRLQLQHCVPEPLPGDLLPLSNKTGRSIMPLISQLLVWIALTSWGWCWALAACSVLQRWTCFCFMLLLCCGAFPAGSFQGRWTTQCSCMSWVKVSQSQSQTGCRQLQGLCGHGRAGQGRVVWHTVSSSTCNERVTSQVCKGRRRSAPGRRSCMTQRCACAPAAACLLPPCCCWPLQVRSTLHPSTAAASMGQQQQGPRPACGAIPPPPRCMW